MLKPLRLQRNLEVISGLSEDFLTYLHAGGKRREGAEIRFRVSKVIKTKHEIVCITITAFLSSLPSGMLS